VIPPEMQVAPDLGDERRLIPLMVDVEPVSVGWLREWFAGAVGDVTATHRHLHQTFIRGTGQSS